MSSKLNGKVALVTGAYRGIGLAIADELAKAGAKVAACDINLDFAGELTKHFQELGLEGKGYCMNVNEKDSIASALEEITNTYGNPNIVVNNAGITKDNLLMRMSDEEWRQVIETNLSSVFLISRSCVRNMLKARWGRIVNIASVVGITGNAGQCNYSASKGGIIAFTKSLARELGSRNITVNAIAPGFIETAMTKKLDPCLRDEMLKTIPLNRVGMPEDIAKAVLFLVSNDAAYITGTTLHVDGGMVMI